MSASYSVGDITATHKTPLLPPCLSNLHAYRNNTQATRHIHYQSTINMSPTRSLASLSVLRHASRRLPSAIPARQIRFVNTQGEELGGVQGSEPPSPQKNPVNWYVHTYLCCTLTYKPATDSCFVSRRAGTITAVGVTVASLVMWRMKASQGDKQ